MLEIKITDIKEIHTCDCPHRRDLEIRRLIDEVNFLKSLIHVMGGNRAEKEKNDNGYRRRAGTA